jgi:hypothetical protein
LIVACPLPPTAEVGSGHSVLTQLLDLPRRQIDLLNFAVHHFGAGGSGAARAFAAASRTAGSGSSRSPRRAGTAGRAGREVGAGELRSALRRQEAEPLGVVLVDRLLAQGRRIRPRTATGGRQR